MTGMDKTVWERLDWLDQQVEYIRKRIEKLEEKHDGNCNCTKK